MRYFMRAPGGTGKRVQHFVRFTFLLPGVEKPGTGPHPGSLDAADTSVCATRRGARTLARRLDTLVETFTINGLHSMLRKLSDIRPSACRNFLPQAAKRPCQKAGKS